MDYSKLCSCGERSIRSRDMNENRQSNVVTKKLHVKFQVNKCAFRKSGFQAEESKFHRLELASLQSYTADNAAFFDVRFKCYSHICR